MEVFKYDELRVKKIDEFMKKLIEAKNSSEKVKIYKEYEEDVLNITPLDIFYLSFYQNDTELSIAEIKESANRFVNVFHKGIAKYASFGEHPLFKELLEESRRMENHLAKFKPYYKKDIILSKRKELIEIFEKANSFELKFQKFENIIFPNLEKYLPSTKPLEVLWELHDDSKDLLNKILNLLNSETTKEEDLIKEIGNYHYLIFGINQKEELILLPVMKQLLSEEEHSRIYNECLSIGFVFNKKYLEKIKIEDEIKDVGFFTSKTGKMDFKQLVLMLNNLPLDITYVDKDDKVIYYNESKNRHFPRTPSVIGREVKNCHPPKSVKIVEDLIDDFKNNKKDFEEFWINFKGKVLYIAYYALRDDQGNYQGVLEASQDISRFINLEGEKRLVDSD